MAIETASFLDNLVAANPDGSDQKYEGDDHIRLLKTTLKATLPGMIGRMWRTQQKGSAYTVVATDNMTVLDCTSALTLDLTAAATLGNGHKVIIRAAGGDVTIDPAGAELVNGAATSVVPQGAVATLLCTGSAFSMKLSPSTLSAFAVALLDDANAAAAQATLGLVPGTNVQAFDPTLAALAALTIAVDSLTVGTGADSFSQVTFGANTFPGKSSAGGLVAKPITDFAFSLVDDADAGTARGTLGLGSIATQAANNVTITGGTITGITDLSVADGGTGASTLTGYVKGSGASPLTASATIPNTDITGLGTISTQNANSVNISGGSVAGITDLAVADGGTGASDAAGARTNLGLVIGTHVQAFDADLAALAGLNSAANKLPYFTGVGTAALTDISSFARDLLDDTNAATMRATLSVLALSGGTLTGALTLSGTPTLDLHAATKAYVDNAAATGIKPTDAVALATTGNITLSGEQSIDGTMTSTSRVLVKNQSTPAQNGIYVSAAGAWARATDMDDWTEVPGRYTFVTGGSTQANTGWSCTSALGGTLGSTAITWALFASPGTYSASGGITLTGTNFTANIGTDIQAFDATLSALAGVTTAANKLPYFTGVDTATVTDLSAFGRTLIDDNDATTARATLGLVIGTNVQAADATLTALAGLTIAANSLSIGSGTDAFSQVTFAANTFPGRSSTGNLVAKAITDFGFSLLDDGDAGTARTTLGLGTIATQAASNVTITGGSITGITDLAVADGGTGASTLTGYVKGSGTSPLTASATIPNTDITGLGTMSTQNASSVAITGGSVTGITDLAVADGGTGASDASGARTNLGLVIGTHVQAFDAGLLSIAGLTTAADRMIYTTASDTYAVATLTSFARTILDDNDAAAVRATLSVSDGSVPQNSQSSAYTLVASDANKHILHPTADNNPRTFTIPANASVAFPIGTTVTFVNEVNELSIAITSDTLIDVYGSTGTRTLAANGIATIIKVADTVWRITGSGLL